MNAIKTEFMVTTSNCGKGKLSSAAYSRKLSGVGNTYTETAKEKVQCIKCGALIVRCQLRRHQASRKCQKASASYVPPTPVRERVAREICNPTPRSEPATYQVSIPRGTDGTIISCPAPNCDYKIPSQCKAKRSTLRGHFARRHMEDKIIIREEGLLPQCVDCGLFAKTANTERHSESAACYNLTEQRRRYFQHLDQQNAENITFQVDGNNINHVYDFKYLGRMLDHTDDDNMAAERQLSRARQRWGRIGKVLSSQQASAKTMGYFYKAIVQAVLLYGSESWTLTESMMNKIRSFHSRIARYICKRHIRQLEDGTWEYPPTAEVLRDAGLETIDTYILRRRKTVWRFTSGRPLFLECRRTRARDTNKNRIVWWNLPVNDFESMIS